jgi:hypothetical protein
MFWQTKYFCSCLFISDIISVVYFPCSCLFISVSLVLVLVSRGQIEFGPTHTGPAAQEAEPPAAQT